MLTGKCILCGLSEFNVGGPVVVRAFSPTDVEICLMGECDNIATGHKLNKQRVRCNRTPAAQGLT